MRGDLPHLRCFPVDLRGRPGTSTCSSTGEPTTSKPGAPVCLLDPTSVAALERKREVAATAQPGRFQRVLPSRALADRGEPPGPPLSGVRPACGHGFGGLRSRLCSREGGSHAPVPPIPSLSRSRRLLPGAPRRARRNRLRRHRAATRKRRHHPAEERRGGVGQGEGAGRCGWSISRRRRARV